MVKLEGPKLCKILPLDLIDAVMLSRISAVYDFPAEA